MITVLFFASIREILGSTKIEVDTSDVSSLSALKDLLIKNNGQLWDEVLNADNVVIAVNHEVVPTTHPLSAGDEVAFFPPVTGG